MAPAVRSSKKQTRTYETKGILDPEGISVNPLTNEPYTDAYRELAKMWTSLPAYEKAHTVLDSLADYPLTFVISSTGSGKSVLVPKYALHYTNYEGKVGMTLPKRSVTQSTASFAAQTLDVELGEAVGYVHKGSDKKLISDSNRILFMTDGTLVAKMQRDPDLTEFKVIIIDEAHERKVQIDLILLFLRNLLQSGRRPDLRVIIMSATIDATKYKSYFTSIPSNIINISGLPNYPITVHFMDEPVPNYLKTGQELIENLISKGMHSDLLFFITTSTEALQLCQFMHTRFPKVFCVEVYAEMDPNMVVYAKSPTLFHELGDYDQKLIMATNLAESSLTFDGLKYVVDSAHEFYSAYDPNSYGYTYAKRLISKAQALQRRGRVGRTAPGVCYHLLTEPQFMNLAPYPDPDILSQDITIILLQITLLTPDRDLSSGLSILSDLMDPPTQPYVDSAVRLYHMYNLLDEDNIPTTDAISLVQFSSISFNRVLFLIYAYQTHCAFEAASIVAMLDVTRGRVTNLFPREPAAGPNRKPKAEAWLKKNAVGSSDHLTLFRIFDMFEGAADRAVWAKQNGLRADLLLKARRGARTVFQRVLRIMQEPKTSTEPIEIKMERVQRPDIIPKLTDALVRSHRHLTASRSHTIATEPVIKGQIDRNTVTRLFYSKGQLEKKRFIYDELSIMNKKPTFSTITII
ncbi:HrpA ATP-dependent RNA helicase [uncultured virus]|nr:HrpA ATP-dependent RNA helicase [uncultured virus]